MLSPPNSGLIAQGLPAKIPRASTAGHPAGTLLYQRCPSEIWNGTSKAAASGGDGSISLPCENTLPETDRQLHLPDAACGQGQTRPAGTKRVPPMRRTPMAANAGPPRAMIL